MTTTFPERTDAALSGERTGWQQQIDELESANSAKDATISGLKTELAKCLEGGGSEPDRLRLSAVQVFPHRLDLPLYVDFPKVFGHLQALGIKRVRGQCGPGTSAAAMGFYKTAWEQYGIKSMLTIGEPRIVVTAEGWTRIESKLTTLGSAAIDSIYGWNEPNSVRGGGTPLPADWAKMTANHQKRLAVLGAKIGVPVGTCAPWSGDVSATWTAMAAVRAAGMTSADYDIIAYHQYPRFNDTYAEFDTFYNTTEAELRKVLVDTTSPFACTEYGWSTAPNAGTSGAVRLTEEQRAERLPMLAKRHVDHGNRHNLFELLNTLDDTGADREDWLGIVHADNVRTPAFYAYRTFLAGT